MKKLLVFFGVVLILPWQLISQETEYVSKKDLQAEKSQLMRSIYSLNKSDKELRSILLFEVQSNDSLAELVILQSAELQAQKEFLQKLETSQADLDSRLLTQRKSGTLMVILIPAGLFLFTLLVLIWLIIFRHRMLSMFNHLDDRLNELSKKLDNLESTFKREQNSLRSELQASVKDAEHTSQNLFTETEERIQKLEKLIQDEKDSHNAKQEEYNKEYKALKGSLQKGYDTLSKDLIGLKEELSGTAKDLTNRLMELVKKSSD